MTPAGPLTSWATWGKFLSEALFAHFKSRDGDHAYSWGSWEAEV